MEPGDLLVQADIFVDSDRTFFAPQKKFVKITERTFNQNNLELKVKVIKNVKSNDLTGQSHSTQCFLIIS